jgi:hypothetical protein
MPIRSSDWKTKQRNINMVKDHDYNCFSIRSREHNYHKIIYTHQLLAIHSGCDPHEVFSNSNHIHHIIPYPFLNIEENLELLNNESHPKLHQKGYKIPDVSDILSSNRKSSEPYDYKHFTYEY